MCFDGEIRVSAGWKVSCPAKRSAGYHVRFCRDHATTERKTENPHDGSSVLQIHFLDPGKEIERPIHKGRLQGKFIIAKGIRN